MIITALIFLLILSVLVLIHELGHFLVAKKLNIKVEEFGFGLPPRLFGIKRGETIYSINWLPIGGFVKLYGEDDAGAGRVNAKRLAQSEKPKALARAFYARPVGQRAAVVVAGVVMNTFLAIVIFYIFMGVAGFRAQLPLLKDHTFYFANTSIKTDILISQVQKNSPAAKVGIPQYAQIVSLNTIKPHTSEEFTAAIKKSQGKAISITWIDPNTHKKTTKSVVPRVNPPKGQGALGVSLFGARSVMLSYETPVQKAFSGITHPINLLLYNFDLIGSLVKSAVRDHDATALGEGVAGPVGIYSLVGTIVQIPNIKERSLELLNLAGILSISLAFFNVLPIPALDGGRLFFILIEGITRRKVNPKYETLAHTIGMAVLLLLIVLITFKDIFQFLL